MPCLPSADSVRRREHSLTIPTAVLLTGSRAVLQVHQRESEILELQLERQKRLQLERQLEEETLRRDELVEQEIRLRERARVQVREPPGGGRGVV